MLLSSWRLKANVDKTERTGSLLTVIQLSKNGTEKQSAQSGELMCGKNDASNVALTMPVTDWWAEGQFKVNKQILLGAYKQGAPSGGLIIATGRNYKFYLFTQSPDSGKPGCFPSNQPAMN